MNAKLDIKNNMFTVTLEGVTADVRGLSGAHFTLGEDLVETGKKYYCIPFSESSVVIDSGDVGSLDFRIWHMVDVGNNKYIIQLHGDTVNVTERDKELPVVFPSEVRSFFQSGNETLTLVDSKDREYVFGLDKQLMAGSDAPEAAILRLVQELDITLFLSRVTHFPED